ncbi:hypothetical protein [Pseudomonas sp. BP01]|uniref:hypothetical protein n=1 Tax=Pseudomonas sp. BP01 TaxID=2976152 RepID=UPI001FA99C8B|nr:hypothetical protein [Pseudomonas sp. BP01]
MDAKLSKALGCLAFALSSVTAISVAMTVYSLIDDPFLKIIFAGAAVLLDVFKYLAWPVAMRLIIERSWVAATGLLFCSLTLGAVSGWATYDRLVGSINASKALHDALSGARAEQLTALIKKDSDFLAALGNAENKANVESAALRERGMITKAQELESAVFNRTDTQRQAAMDRIKANSYEISGIQASVVKASSVPALLAAILCAGFALSLELVPALILAILPRQKPEVAQIEEASIPSSVVIAVSENEQNTELVSNNSLLDVLMKQAAELPMHSKIKVKDFATKNRIGNVKACQAFKIAEELGAIQKTKTGWITAQPHLPLQSV